MLPKWLSVFKLKRFSHLIWFPPEIHFGLAWQLSAARGNIGK